MEIAEHIAALRREGQRLADTAAAGDLGAPTPSCPEWTVADVLRHTGGVHRWAASYVTTGRPGPTTTEEEAPYFAAPAGDELVAWYREGHSVLVDALSAADPDLATFSFLPAPSPLAFWARRQAHETAIHRVDVELAAGRPTPCPTDFALDGLDELLIGFFGRRRPSLAADPPRTIGVHPTDADTGWTMRLEPESRTTTVGRDDTDLTLAGTAADLYYFLWNRVGEEAVDVRGDRTLLALWRDHAQVRWV